MAYQPHCCRTGREAAPAPGVMAGQGRHRGSPRRGDGPCGRVYSEACVPGDSPASIARRSRLEGTTLIL